MSTLYNQPRAESYYAASAHPAPKRPVLKGDHLYDVCVIGGGITGCSAALHLAEQGYRVALLEANSIGWGASGRSGGQAILGYNKSVGGLARMVGNDDMQRLWQMNLESKQLLIDTVTRHNIDCDLKWGHLMMAIKARQEDELKALGNELQRLVGYGEMRWLDRAEARQRVGSDTYRGALEDPGSGHLHPLNYTLGLAAAAERAGVEIYENSPVVSFCRGDQPQVITPEGHVRCAYVLLCANAYLGELSRPLARKIMPVGTFIIATEPLDQEQAQQTIRDDDGVVDINFVLNYWRLSADKRLLFGGRVSYSGLIPFDLKATMSRTMHRIYPHLRQVRVDYAWGGNVAITVNRLPHFGRLDRNVFFAHGFSGHGILLTGLAGKLMAEAVQGTAERFDVFTRIPHMSFPGGRWTRKPLLVLSMAYFKLRDLL